jgi:hypothetical protein
MQTNVFLMEQHIFTYSLNIEGTSEKGLAI